MDQFAAHSQRGGYVVTCLLVGILIAGMEYLVRVGDQLVESGDEDISAVDWMRRYELCRALRNDLYAHHEVIESRLTEMQTIEDGYRCQHFADWSPETLERWRQRQEEVTRLVAAYQLRSEEYNRLLKQSVP